MCGGGYETKEMNGAAPLLARNAAHEDPSGQEPRRVVGELGRNM